MQLKQIESFVAVVEEGNLTAAAQRLHISQPPLTRQIQQLEEELGVLLFNRTRKGMEITAAGEAFLDEAHQVLAHVQLAADRSQAASKGEIGNLEIGYYGSCIYYILPQLIKGFYLKYPEVKFSLHQMNKRQQNDAIKDGRIHIGFARHFHAEPGMSIQPIMREKLLLALPKNHSLSSRKVISLSSLKHEALILFPKFNRPSFADEVIRALKRKGINPNVSQETNDLSSAMALVSAGLGVCPIPESAGRLSWPDIDVRPLSDSSAESSVGCIYPTDSQSPILVSFLEHINQFITDSN